MIINFIERGYNMITIYGLDNDAYETAVDAIGSDWFDDIVVTEIGLDVRLAEGVATEYSV